MFLKTSHIYNYLCPCISLSPGMVYIQADEESLLFLCWTFTPLNKSQNPIVISKRPTGAINTICIISAMFGKRIYAKA